jgi:sirohydrochlorin cobaltochelatase
MATGIILFGHGSRDPLWRLPMESVAARILALQPAARVRCAYLELCDPDIHHAAADLIASGADHIRVFPLFLGVGKHAREDLPLLIAQLREAHPGFPIDLMPAAGEHLAVVDLLASLSLSAG